MPTLKLGPYQLGPNDTPENGIYTGDARELARAIPDESVDLIFTDPVYQNIDDYAWLAETAARVLRPGGNIFAYQGHVFLGDTLHAMSAVPGVKYRWIVTEQKIGTQSSIFGKRVLSRTKHALVFYKPPLTKKWLVDYTDKMPSGSGNHQWHKGESVIYWLSQFDARVVFDPFVGGGTTPAVCKMLGRRYLAFEIDPTTADLARRHVAETQPPLPGINSMVQGELEFR